MLTIKFLKDVHLTKDKEFNEVDVNLEFKAGDIVKGFSDLWLDKFNENKTAIEILEVTDVSRETVEEPQEEVTDVEEAPKTPKKGKKGE